MGLLGRVLVIRSPPSKGCTPQTRLHLLSRHTSPFSLWDFPKIRGSFKGIYKGSFEGSCKGSKGFRVWEFPKIGATLFWGPYNNYLRYVLYSGPPFSETPISSLGFKCLKV